MPVNTATSLNHYLAADGKGAGHPGRMYSKKVKILMHPS